jgi:hypothetical protein
MIEEEADNGISVLRAFDAMRFFLEDYWKRGGKSSDDIAILLGSLNRDPRTRSMPLDHAHWHDWMTAVNAAIAFDEPSS